MQFVTIARFVVWPNEMYFVSKKTYQKSNKNLSYSVEYIICLHGEHFVIVGNHQERSM